VRLLVLGASGFLGRHIADAARAEGIEVVTHERRVLDLAVGGIDLLRSHIVGVRPDAVVNATGATHGTDEELIAGNATVVERLLAALSGGRMRLVQLGSSAEIGPSTPGVPIGEEAEARPVTVYGRTKLAATQAVCAATGVDAIVLRVFNPVGAGMDVTTLPGRAARQLHRALAAGDDHVELGPLDDWRDFVDARDVAAAVLAAASAAPGERLFHIGSGTATQARDLVRRLAAIAGFGGRIEEVSAPSARSSAVPWQAADIRRAGAVLGWRPAHALDEALAALWAADRPPGGGGR
jgi:nucleoside-diphosphate-sugar epimerase